MTITRNPREAALEAVAEAARKYRDVDMHNIGHREWRKLLDALAALDALPAADGGWRPIGDPPARSLNPESPWDGKDVLIGWFALLGQTSMAVAWWHDTRRRWIGKHDEYTGDPNWQPTHWQPLPPPPASAPTRHTGRG